MLAWGVLNSNSDPAGDDLSADADVTLVETAAATPSPVPGDTSAVTSREFPPDLLLVVQVGGGESQISGIVRVSSGPDSGLRTETVFSASTDFGKPAITPGPQATYGGRGAVLPDDRPVTPQPGIPDNGRQKPYIIATAASPDAQAIVVSVCVQGWCGGSPGLTSDNPVTVLYRSMDGGASWSELSRTAGIAEVQVVTEDGRALVARPPALADATGTTAYVWEPGGEDATAVTPQPEHLDIDLGNGLRVTTIPALNIPEAPDDSADVPALITADGVSAITTPFFDADFPHGFLAVLGAMQGGPFNRVATGDGCLELHEEPSDESPVGGLPRRRRSRDRPSHGLQARLGDSHSGLARSPHASRSPWVRRLTLPGLIPRRDFDPEFVEQCLHTVLTIIYISRNLLA